MPCTHYRITGLLPVILLLSMVCCSRQQEPGYSEEILEAEDGFTMKMEQVISTPPARAYEILTDFQHFPEFMPSCSSVDILKKEGDSVVIETRRFIKFIGKNLAGKMEYKLSPNKISTRSINHPMADFEEEWTLEPDSGTKGTRVKYTSFSKMKIPMPDYMCQGWLRDTFKDTLAAIEKRAGQTTTQTES